MLRLIRKIKLFFVKPKIEECIFSYVENTIDEEYYFLMNVHFSVHDTKTKKIIGIKTVTKIIDSEQETEQIKRVIKKHPGVLNESLNPRCKEEILEKAKKVLTYDDLCQFSKEG